MSTEKFNELGLTFKKLTPSDFDEISKFQMLYFFPDEPIARSTKLLEGSGIINKYISSLVKKHMIDPCLKDEVSVAAYNKDGEIIGVRYIKISKLSEISLKTLIAFTLRSFRFKRPYFNLLIRVSKVYSINRLLTYVKIIAAICSKDRIPIGEIETCISKILKIRCECTSIFLLEFCQRSRCQRNS